jgi:hypothetical protein
LCRNSGLVAGTEGEEEDDPLPQSDATPDGRGVADHQGEDVSICKDRAKIEQWRRLFLSPGIPARQRRPRDKDATGTEDAGDNKSATPAQQRSDPAEKE